MLLLPVEGCAPDFSEVWPRDWVSLEGPPRLGIVERGGEVEELLLLRVGREPRHRGSARVGYRPCRLQFLVHLLEKGDAAGN